MTNILFEEGRLERLVSGALTASINAHGPVRLADLGSAAKRVAGQIRGELTQNPPAGQEHAVCTAVIDGLKKEIAFLRSRDAKLHSQVRYWREKAVIDNTAEKIDNKTMETSDV